MTGDPTGYCEQHRSEYVDPFTRADKRRGSAEARGYGTRWRRYSKYFLSLPENQFCRLRLDDNCAIVAQCVDHIDPPDGPDDPRFWDPNNHQAACIHCNSVKGHRRIAGGFVFGIQKGVR